MGNRPYRGWIVWQVSAFGTFIKALIQSSLYLSSSLATLARFLNLAKMARLESLPVIRIEGISSLKLAFGPVLFHVTDRQEGCWLLKTSFKSTANCIVMIKNSIETQDSLSNVRVCTVVGKWQGGMPFHYGFKLEHWTKLFFISNWCLIGIIVFVCLFFQFLKAVMDEEFGKAKQLCQKSESP